MKRRAWIYVLLLGLILQGCGTTSTSSHISRLTLSGTDLYFGAGYCFYRLDTKNQSLQAILCTKDWTFQRSAIDGERAYTQVLTQPGEAQIAVALDLSTGEVIWQARVRPRSLYGPIPGDTVLLNGQVCIEYGTGLGVLDTLSGTWLWQSEHNWMTASSYQIHDGLIWYPIHTEEGDAPEDGRVVAVDPETGETQQTVDLLPDFDFDQLLYIDDKRIFGVDSPDYTSRDQVFAVDWELPGEAMWSREMILPNFPDDPVLLDDSLVFSSLRVYALDVKTGRTKWMFDPNEPYSFTESSKQIVTFAISKGHGQNRDRYLYGLESTSGAAVWEYQLKGIGYRVVSEDIVYLANGDSIDALDLKTGRLLWQVLVDSEIKIWVDWPESRFIRATSAP